MIFDDTHESALQCGNIIATAECDTFAEYD